MSTFAGSSAGGGTRKDEFSRRRKTLAFTVAHKSASNKIRKTRGGRRKETGGVVKKRGRKERRSKTKPRDEFIHGRRGVERGWEGKRGYKCKIGNTYEICVGSSKKG